MQEQKLSYFIGIDVGTTAVRCIVGELAEEAAVPSVIGFSSAENTGMRKGNVAHVDEVAEAIVRPIDRSQLRTALG
jgi:cell division ATPase FtsA